MTCGRRRTHGHGICDGRVVRVPTTRCPISQTAKRGGAGVRAILTVNGSDGGVVLLWDSVRRKRSRKWRQTFPVPWEQRKSWKLYGTEKRRRTRTPGILVCKCTFRDHVGTKQMENRIGAREQDTRLGGVGVWQVETFRWHRQVGGGHTRPSRSTVLRWKREEKNR